MSRGGAVVWGGDDRRVRATWRVLLPWPLLWFAAGTLGVAAAGAVVPEGASRPTRMLAFGLFQAGFSGAAWVAWSRYLDRRPLSDYGLALSRSWLRAPRPASRRGGSPETTGSHARRPRVSRRSRARFARRAGPRSHP